MDPDIVKVAQLAVIIGAFGGAATVLWLTVKVVLSRLESKTTSRALPPEHDDRLARLEQAVDTIAIEIERIAEAQRFSAKLMNERLPERLESPKKA
jgi:hypothetical protein